MQNIKLKNEVEIYYKSHEIGTKELSALFNVPLRTLQDWIKKGNWQKGEALKNTNKELKNEILKTELATAKSHAKAQIKEQIKENLGIAATSIPQKDCEAILESAANEVILKEFTRSEISAELDFAASIARAELEKMHKNSLLSEKADPMLIACAEKCVNIYTQIAEAKFGKNTQLESSSKVEIEELDLDDLAQIKAIAFSK